MAFDNSTRNRLQRLVSDCRDLLTREFDAKLKEIYGVYADEGRVLGLEKLATLDDEKLRVASLLRERINHLASAGGGTPAAISEAVKRLLREQAFTVLNRFAALRMAEERGIIVESVGGGLNSKGFKTYSEVAHSGLGTAYERYRVFLGCMFDEMATDLGVLFDRRSPYGLLFPRENVLLEMFGLLNAPEVKPLWKEDETVGWIYQYFNDPAERKKMRELSAAPRNSRELAVRNQFFTPRYVVEFLTDNTLGRIWYEMCGSATSLREKCRYLVRRPNEIFLKPGEAAPVEPKQDNLSQEELLKQPVFIPHRPLKDPRTLLMLDPACGSMHFGLYAFDLYEIIYEEAWELEGVTGALSLARPAEMKSLRETFANKDEFLRQVPRLIIEHNLHGIDIDPRCAQIAGLSLWLRAQKSWQWLGLKAAKRPRITRSNIVCAEPMPGEKELLREFVEKEFTAAERGVFLQLLETIFDKMQLVGDAGSLLKIEEEISSAIEVARAARQKLQTRPAELFSTGEMNAASKQSELTATSDLRLLTADFFEGVEERIYAALRDYAEQAEQGGGFQRRLFAEDAARGFAFIDVCCKRYDVALMNPPFGAAVAQVKSYLARGFPQTKNDLYAAFIERGLNFLCDGGRVGAITSRTGFFLGTFQQWREEVLLKQCQLLTLADLGADVLDGAVVEVASYVLEKGSRLVDSPSIFFRLLATASKAEKLESAISGADTTCVFSVNPVGFGNIPTSPFAYWVPDGIRTRFAQFPSFEPAVGDVRCGLSTNNNPRFVRTLWEVPPENHFFCYYPTGENRHFCSFDDPVVRSYLARKLHGRRIWSAHVMAGTSQPWFSPMTVVVNWENHGSEIKAYARSLGNSPSRNVRSEDYYFRPGISWTRRAVRMIPYVIPSNAIPTASRYMAFPNDGLEPLALGCMSSNFATAYLRMFGEWFTRPNFLVDTLKSLPWSVELLGLKEQVEKVVRQEVAVRRGIYRGHEPFHEFVVPFGFGKASKQDVNFSWVSLLGDELDCRVAAAYGINDADFKLLQQDVQEAVSVRNRTEAEKTTLGEEAIENDDDDAVLDTGEYAVCESNLSYILGVAFGRWDIRYATGEQAAPDLPDPFAPLPVCPPGQLQNAQGLPARPEEMPAGYPLKNIPWAGILVDDESHQCDLVARVREVIEIIWSGAATSQSADSTSAETIEHEACKILGVKSLRDYFRKPAGFFADHLKRYSKSRRQAPIYWPLATASGSYTLWIYYHRLTDQTLFQCVNDFVKPKITEVEGDLSRITTAGADKPGARAGIEHLTILRAELVEFRDDLLRVAQLPYKPNLNDGVLITASPLWKLFRLPKWQKDLKACWSALENEEYEWAHLAYTLWPDRVKAVCKKDRSFAIAHGLESLCEINAPEKKAKKNKKKPDTELTLTQD